MLKFKKMEAETGLNHTKILIWPIMIQYLSCRLHSSWYPWIL